MYIDNNESYFSVTDFRGHPKMTYIVLVASYNYLVIVVNLKSWE